MYIVYEFLGKNPNETFYSFVPNLALFHEIMTNVWDYFYPSSS